MKAIIYYVRLVPVILDKGMINLVFHLSVDEDHNVENTHKEEDELGIICSPEEDRNINLPFHIRCGSHVSLIAKPDAKNINRNILKKQSLTKNAETIRRVFGCRFKCPVLGRWKSLYDATCLLLTKKESLTTVLCELNLPTFTENDIKFLEEYECVIAPIAASICRLQG